MYQPSQAWKYISGRRPLTTFAVITLILIVCTIINAIVCTLNFNKGLKEHVLKSEKRVSVGQSSSIPTPLGKLSRRNREEDDQLDETNHLHPKKPSARMTIE